MDQFASFITNHWILATAFVAILGMLIASFGLTAGGLTPQAAVIFLNHDRAVAVDLRPLAEYTSGHIIDAVHAPVTEFPAVIDTLKSYAERPLLVYCATGTQCARAIRDLKQQGFGRVQALKGGLTAWRTENLPVVAK